MSKNAGRSFLTALKRPFFHVLFDPQNAEMPKFHRDDLEALGVVVAHWTLVSPR